MKNKIMKLSTRIFCFICMLSLMLCLTLLDVQAAAKKPKKMSITATCKTIDIKGQTKITVKSVSPANSSKKVSFKSSNKKIATVNGNGIVTGKKKGTVKITVTSKANKKLKKTIKIKVADLKPSRLVLKNTATVILGSKTRLSATLSPAGVYCPLRWTSSNSKIVSVDANGMIYAKSLGIAKISCTGTQKGSNGRFPQAVVTIEVVRSNSFSGQHVISAKEAKSKVGSSAVFVDARGIKNTQTTILGAITTNWNSLSNTEGLSVGDPLYATPLSPKKASEKLSVLGLGLNDEIILFADKHPTTGWGEDGRILWQLLEYGYTNVKMVDGGLSTMVAYGVPTQIGASAPVSKTVNITSCNPYNSISTDDLINDLKGKREIKIIDVRTTSEFDGSLDHGVKQGGHIKSAIHIPYTDLFNNDGTLKTVPQITKLFEEKGIQKTDKIAAYCVGGIRSAYMQVVLEMCGFTQAVSYTESWWRWSSLDNYDEIQAPDRVFFQSSEDVRVGYAKEFSNPAIAEDKSQVTYISSNPNVATVDKNGYVKILDYGEAIITATANCGSDSYKITCRDYTQKYSTLTTSDWEKTGITYEDMIKEMKNGAVILDVRQPSFITSTQVDFGYNKGHIKGSIHVPCFPVEKATETAVLQSAMDQNLIPKDEKIIIICQSGLRGSRTAKSYLVNNEYNENNITFLLYGGNHLIRNYLTDTEHVEITPDEITE